MSEDTKNRPDGNDEVKGWVAWHPKWGSIVGRTRPHEMAYESEDAAWYALQVFRMSTCKTKEQLTSDGWRIRPVKLVFLDEVKE